MYKNWRTTWTSLWFSNMENDSASLHHLIKKNLCKSPAMIPVGLKFPSGSGKWWPRRLQKRPKKRPYKKLGQNLYVFTVFKYGKGFRLAPSFSKKIFVGPQPWSQWGWNSQVEAWDDGQEGCRKGQKRGHTKKGQRRRRLEDGRNACLEETIDREENGRSQKVKYVYCAHCTTYPRVSVHGVKSLGGHFAC